MPSFFKVWSALALIAVASAAQAQSSDDGGWGDDGYDDAYAEDYDDGYSAQDPCADPNYPCQPAGSSSAGQQDPFTTSITVTPMQRAIGGPNLMY